jgi:hypothetical protein
MGDYGRLSRFIIEILISFSSHFLSVTFTSWNEFHLIIIINRLNHSTILQSSLTDKSNVHMFTVMK